MMELAPPNENRNRKGKKMILRDSAGNALGHTEVTDTDTHPITRTPRNDSAAEFAAELWATALS